MGLKLRLGLKLASATGVVAAGTTPGPPPVTLVAADLLRDWRFDEGSGSPTDLIVGEAITLSGATWTSYGVLFDGVDDVGVLPTALVTGDLVGLASASFGVLFRVVSYKAGGNNVVNLASTMELGLIPASFRPVFGARTNLDTASLTLTAVGDNILVGNWYYVVLNYDGATLDAFEDGTLRGSRAKTGTLAAAGSAPRIGADENGANFANVEIAAFHIYRASVTSQTVADNAAAMVTLLAGRGP